MDIYLQKKIAFQKSNRPNQTKTDKQDYEHLLDKARDELESVVKQIDVAARRLENIRILAKQIEIKLYPQGKQSLSILGEPPLQKSHLETEILDRIPSKSNYNIQQNMQLERIARMATQVNSTKLDIVNDENDADKLSQSSKITRRGRKAIKKI